MAILYYILSALALFAGFAWGVVHFLGPLLFVPSTKICIAWKTAFVGVITCWSLAALFFLTATQL